MAGRGGIRMTREPVKSAVRALDILKLFSELRRDLTQKEIILRLGYPQSSATFLLKSLVSAGYLSFDRKRRTYLPAPEVYQLGKWLEDLGYEQMFRHGVLTELLADLRTRTGHTISLTSQNDIFVQWHRIVGETLSHDPPLCEGAALPLIWSSYGCVLLSRESDAQIDRVVRLINARERVPECKVDVAHTTAMLREIRSNTVFYMVNTRLNEAASIATVLPMRIAGRHIAVGVGGDRTHITPRRDSIMQSLSDTLSEYEADLIAAFPRETEFPALA